MLLYSNWIKLPLYVRAEIAQKFGIAKVGPTHVQDNVVVSDGYKIEDIERAMNIEALQEYLGSKEKDSTILWNAFVITFLPQQEVKVPSIVEKSEKIEVIKEPVKKTIKRKAK